MADDIFGKIVETLIDTKDEISEVTDVILEAIDYSDEDDQMSYLLKFEEYLDECGIYAYEGWGDTIILSAPTIEKFWFQVDIKVPSGTDLSGTQRIIGKHDQNTVNIRKSGDDFVCRVRILRSELDKIERENRRNAEKIAKSQGGNEQPLNANNQMPV